MKRISIIRWLSAALICVMLFSLSSCSPLFPFEFILYSITASQKNRETEQRLRNGMDLETMLENQTLLKVTYPGSNTDRVLVDADGQRLVDITSPGGWTEIDGDEVNKSSPTILETYDIVFREDGTAKVTLRDISLEYNLTLYFDIPDAEFENIRAYAEELYTVVYPQQEYEKKKEEARAQIDLDTLILECEGYLIYPEGSKTGTETTADTLYGKVQPLFWTPTEASPSPDAKPILTLLLGGNDSKEDSKEDSEDGNTLEIVSDKTAVLKFSLGKDHPTFEFYFTVPDSDYSVIRDFAAEIAPE